ncbi:glycosyltransferase [Enterococcus devriesei]|uniref:Glycosyl transferase family 1 domain-containing protein n=1 Tax=Enterococcus devriesei TaxID=319970 RepID=A0A1L8SZP6_9ENTE|nr:glycosyltransferase [Enterococcus devriesei]OJG37428.1 hypothetical protein RV00_GL000385 [Enterococcus devriesei]
MKICIVGPSFGYGGANIVASTIGKELSKENEVFYYSYKFRENYSKLPEDKLFFSSKKEKRMLSKFGKGLELAFKKEFTPSKYKKNEINDLFEIIEKNSVDVVILNSFIAVTIFAEELKNKFSNIKVIAWMHEDPDYAFNELAKNYLTSFSKSLKIVDSIVCLSEKAYDIYREINNNTQVIYNPMVLESGRISDLNDKVVSFTARLNVKVKGLDFLCEIAREIPDDWKIRIAGNGRPEEVQEFLNLISERNVSDKIEYVGPLKGKALEEHYLKSSIFLSTSRTEALPLVIIEALSYGLPIISFDHSGAKELLDNGEIGILVSDFDTQLMVKKINLLIMNKSLRKKYQDKSLLKAKLFDINVIMSEWKNVLND